jgi:EAL domain-containing protein (putative c-di-GMP-specific phosphodiesterase class I)/FixJ family two-component response regulator
MSSLAAVAEGSRHECVVIDDDPDICALISRVLAKIGIASVGISSADALVGALKSVRPSIIFLDVALDRSDAIDGIRILRQTRFDGAVQLISGRDTELLNNIKAIGERHGLKMLDPLQKPFRSEQLRRLFSAAGDAKAPSAVEVTTRYEFAPKKEEETPAPIIDLEEALEAHWLDMHYQPKVDLVRNRVVGAEGLARVNHPVHGILGPTSFLPNAPDKALHRLTEFVVRKAFLDWEVMRSVGRNLHLSVNSPVKALTAPGLADLVREFHPRDKNWPGLIIEVTEEEAVREFDAIAEAAVQLRIYGVTLAIDDFGSGYSSFARLKQFPFTELKLDRSFVVNCADDPVNARICQSIVDLARASSAICVAEGIETEKDWAALIRMGCHLGQGFFFGKPMSVGRLIDRSGA